MVARINKTLLFSLIASSIAFIPCPLVSAQQARIVTQLSNASTDSSPTILIKTYTEHLIFTEGIHLYRKASHESTWMRITEQPIQMMSTLPSTFIGRDESIRDYFSIASELNRTGKIEKLIMLNLFLKTFQSNDFAEALGIYFKDAEIETGTTYEYRVNRIVNGKEISVATSKPIIARAYVPDFPIDSVRIFQKEKKVAFNWKHEPDRYYAVNIYRTNHTDSTRIKLNKDPLMLSEVKGADGKLSYPDPMFMEDRNLKESNHYSYELTGLGFFGDETQLSKPVSLFFKDTTPPPAPTDLIGKTDSMKVHLKWQNIAAPDLRGVRIYRSARSDGPYSTVNGSVFDTSVSSFTDSISVPGPYYYYVASIDTTGNEAHSNLIFAEVQDVIPPRTPEELKIQSDTGLLHLTWKMGTEPDLAGYHLFRTVDAHNQKRYVLLNAIPLKADHFAEKLPKNVKNKFFYYIVAVDTSYNRSKPSQFATGKMPDILAPEKPFIKNVSYGDGMITVNWIQNVDHDLAGYNLYRADTTKIFTKLNVNPLGPHTFRYNDRSHQPNVDYYYYLEAFDSAGNVSVKSNLVYARRFEKPKEETLLTIRVKARYNKRKNQMQISWKYDEDIIKENSLGFIVYRGVTETDLRPVSAMIQQSKISLDVRKLSLLKQGFYQVRGYFNDKIIYSTLVKEKI